MLLAADRKDHGLETLMASEMYDTTTILKTVISKGFVIWWHLSILWHNSNLTLQIAVPLNNEYFEDGYNLLIVIIAQYYFSHYSHFLCSYQ